MQTARAHVDGRRELPPGAQSRAELAALAESSNSRRYTRSDPSEFTMRETFVCGLIPATPAREIMLAPRLNEGCPLARVTLRAARAGGRAATVTRFTPRARPLGTDQPAGVQRDGEAQGA